MRTNGTTKLVLLILTLVILRGAAVAQPYRWVDEAGETHMTDDPNSIPEKYRAGGGRMTPPAQNPAASPAPGGADSGRSAVALWLRTGGLRGEQQPVLIQVYDSEAMCMAERDRRTAVHVSQGMQRTNQPGLAISNLGGAVTGGDYFAYRCVPAGIRPP